jgi:hypothetical protein
MIHHGRTAEKPVKGLPRRSCTDFTECPQEVLKGLGKVHNEPLGHVHICPGNSLANLLKQDLAEFCKSYDPERYPMTGPLPKGSPAELVRRYGLEHEVLTSMPATSATLPGRSSAADFPRS